MDIEVVKYLSELNQKIRKGCTAHITKSGRLYYMNHETKTSSWLPPVESWDSGGNGLPYGWEAAFDRDGKTYFINHVNKTTTSEDPRKDSEEEPPQPREVELLRDPQKGFGFVAGSEKPVIVRFVTEGGPSEGKLLPGDQILQINGDDVQKSPRERVIELVRSCKHSVKLQVCQPITNNTTRKSALLTAAKKAKLKSNPSRVRFAEGVVINGSPLYCPSPYESYVPFMPNVLKVFLENGQTKSFKYDSTTTVQDVLNVLQEKLSVVSLDHFALVVEHIKAVKRNKFAILNPKDTLAKIAARPGAHNLRCLFRLTFVPKDIYEFMQKDAVGFDYLFMQCCNDVVRERFAPELKYDVTLRLAALHLHQHALNTGIQGKMVVKTIEREYGLEKFVPASLLDTMKRKELVKLLSQLMKQNQALSGPGQKQLTSLQAKFHYLKIVSELPSYGAKLFATPNKNSMAETALIVGPKVGISQISTIRYIAPINLAQFSEIESIEVTKEDDFSFKIRVALKHPEKESLTLSMEDRDAEEFVLVLERYYSQLVGGEIPVQWEGRDPEPVETVPTFHSRHTVQESPWSYCPSSLKKDSGTTTILRTVDLSIPPPPYIPCEERQLSRSNSRDQFSLATSPASVDHNMNEMQALVASIASLPTGVPSSSSMPNLKSHSSLDARSNNISSNSTTSIPEDETTCIFHIGHNSEETSNSADFESGQSNAYTASSRNNRPGTAMKALQNLADHTDTIAVQLQKQTEPSGIDIHSVMSIELLEGVEGDITGDLDVKSQDVISRVNEMSKIVNDAECYLNTDSTTYTVDLGSRCHDSLLFLPCNNEERNSEEIFDQLLTPDSDLLPSESEGESTPTNSPRHCPDSESPTSTARKCSSFGLHSVNLFGNLDQETQDVEELLRQLQTSTNLPIKEGSLCLDPDIIDLTIVPPPSTDDVNFSHVGEDEDAELTSQLSELTPQNSPVRSCAAIEQAFAENPDSTRMPSSSQHMFHSSSFPSTPSVQPSPLEMDTFSSADIDDSGVINYCAHSSASCDEAEREDDLSAYIIPPPPSSSSVVEEQNRVLARFRQAAEDIRRMMAHGSDAASCSRYSDSMSSVSKFCTIPRRHDDGHRNNSSSLASLVTPVRETHGKIGLPHASMFNGRLQHNNESSSNEPESPLVCSQADDKLNTSCDGPENFSTLNSVRESQAEMSHGSEENSWRPQPPPRLKKLSSSCSESSSSSTDCFPLISSSLPCNNNASDCSSGEQGEAQTSSGLDKGSFSRTLSLDSFKGAVQRNKEKASQNKTDGIANVPVSLPSNLESAEASEDSCCAVSQFSSVVPAINGHNHKSENHSQDMKEFRHQLNGTSPKIPNGSGSSYVNGGCPDRNPENREIAHALSENSAKECHDCQGEKGLINGCVCRKIDRFSSYHQSLPRKVINGGLHVVPIGDINGDGIVENGHCVIDSIGSFQEAQQEIDDMIFHLDATCQTRLRECEGGLNQDRDLSKLANDWETLMLESRQFVTASKLFVKSITESSDKMEGNLSTCVTLLDRIFTVSEFVIMQMSTSCQITTLAAKLKETATAYSRTVQAAHSASSGGIMNPNMASLMHEATSLATSLTMLMRTLRTFYTP